MVINWFLITGSEAEYVTGSANVVVTDLERVELTLSTATLSEAGGSITATVSRTNTDQSSALTVNLTSSDETEATVPRSIIIPANQSRSHLAFKRKTIPCWMVCNRFSIHASASGYASSVAELTVSDSESLSLQLSSSSISEKDGQLTATVSRNNTDIGSPLTILIENLDPSELAMPASVVIPADSRSVTFIVRAQDDTLLDGSQLVSISVAAAGYESAQVAVTITDSESLSIVLDRSSMAEKSGYCDRHRYEIQHGYSPRLGGSTFQQPTIPSDDSDKRDNTGWSSQCDFLHTGHR